MNQLRSQTYKALASYLNDPKSSLASQFGALSAMSCLGPEVLRDCVLPHMDKYLMNLEAKMNDKNQSTNGHTGQSRIDKNKILSLNLMRGTFLMASRDMLQEQQRKNFLRQYSMLYSHFGDSLVMSPTLSVPNNLSWPSEESPQGMI